MISVKCFLGLEFEWDIQNGIMKLSQTKYLKFMLDKFGIAYCNAMATPTEMTLYIYIFS